MAENFNLSLLRIVTPTANSPVDVSHIRSDTRATVLGQAHLVINYPCEGRTVDVEVGSRALDFLAALYDESFSLKWPEPRLGMSTMRGGLSILWKRGRWTVDLELNPGIGADVWMVENPNEPDEVWYEGGATVNELSAILDDQFDSLRRPVTTAYALKAAD
jgi:hypothetical protein